MSMSFHIIEKFSGTFMHILMIQFFYHLLFSDLCVLLFSSFTSLLSGPFFLLKIGSLVSLYFEVALLVVN